MFILYEMSQLYKHKQLSYKFGQVTLEVYTHSHGYNTSFQINVTIINISDKFIVESKSFSFMKYISNTIVPLTIVLTNGGSFSFNITTTNRYGTSEVLFTGEIIIQPSEYYFTI